MNSYAILAQQTQGSALLSFLPMLLVFAIFYVVWFMPIRRRQKELQSLIDSLKKGDRIVTNSGIYGEIARADEQVLLLKVADNVKIRIARSAVAGLEGEPRSRNEGES